MNSKLIKIGLIGIGLIFFSTMGVIFRSSYSDFWDWMLVTGVVLSIPLGIRLCLKILIRGWDLCKRMIYEVVYEVSKAVQDGKKEDKCP